jgi:hypothetical protein
MSTSQKTLTAIEALVSADQRRDSDQRRVSVNQHAAFRQSIQPPAHDLDEIDDLAADVIHDNYSQRKGTKQTNHLLSILDNLDKGARP